MTRFALMIALAVVPMEPLFGQLDQIWQADFDGTALAQEEILASTVDISGNLIITGWVGSPKSDALVAKYDSAGVELWREYFDSPDHDSEVGRRVVTDGSGDVYVLCDSRSSPSNLRIFVVKYSSDGALLWSSFDDEVSIAHQVATAIALGSGGGAYVCATFQAIGEPASISVRKYSPTGAIQWMETFPDTGTQWSEARDLTVGSDNSVYVVGAQSPVGPYEEGLLIKYSSDGVLGWVRRESNDSINIQIYGVRALPNDELAIAGYRWRDEGSILYVSRWDSSGARLWTSEVDTPYIDGDYVAHCINPDGSAYGVGQRWLDDPLNEVEVVIVRFDADGNLRWRTRYETQYNGYEEGSLIASDGLGNAYLSGRSSIDSVGSEDAFVAKYDSNGSHVWTRFLADSAGGYMEWRSLLVAPSGGILVSGPIYRLGFGTDGLTLAYDGSGIPLWKQSIDGITHAQDYFREMVVDDQGNIVLTGMTDRSGIANMFDIAAVKYAPDGSLVWSTMYEGGWDVTLDKPWAMTHDAAGNIYVSGSTYDFDSTTILTAKFTSEGEVAWSRVFPSSDHDNVGEHIAVDDSGNVLVAGNSHWGGSRDITVIKYNGEGQQLWVAHHPALDGYDGIGSMALDGHGNVYVTGWSSNGTQFDIVTVRFSSNDGTIDWDERFGLAFPRDMAQSPDGSLYIVGHRYQGSTSSALVIKYDSAGTELWSRIDTLTPPLFSASDATQVELDPDGLPVVVVDRNRGAESQVVRYSTGGSKIWVSDTTRSMGLALAFDSAGHVYMLGYPDDQTTNRLVLSKFGVPPQEEWVYDDSSFQHTFNDGVGLAILGDGSIIIGSTGSDPITGKDFRLKKFLETVTDVRAVDKEVPDEWMLAEPFPNPFNPVTKVRYAVPVRSEVTIRLYDILGREQDVLVSGFEEPGMHYVEIDGTGYPSGVYFCRMTAAGFSSTKKLILNK